MAGLQRSEISFRRQGSSGLVWDDKLIAEMNREKPEEEEDEEQQGIAQTAESTTTGGEGGGGGGGGGGQTIERSRSNREKPYRTMKMSSAPLDPPSPKVSTCGFCANIFGKPPQLGKPHKPKFGKRKS